MSWAVSKLQERADSDRPVHMFLREIYSRTKFDAFTWNPPNVPGASTVDTTLTTTDAPVLEGLRVGMAIFVSPPSTLDAGLVFGGAWVAADNTLTIRLGNVTAGGINPVSGIWSFEGTVT